MPMLRRRGAKKNVQNLRDVTPLLAASFFGHAPVVEALLQRCVRLADPFRLLMSCSHTHVHEHVSLIHSL